MPHDMKHNGTVVLLVDWELACIGDPAYDLAIVSRGNRNVHGVKGGINVLVEEYLAFGGRTISVTDVRVHELLLVLRWLEEAWREYQKPKAQRGTRGMRPYTFTKSRRADLQSAPYAK